MEFETEEQQIEALKKWWKENGKQVIFGAVIGFALIGGWRYYLGYSVQQKSEASALFEQVIKDDAGAKQQADKKVIFDKIQKDYAGTAYLSSAGLVLAKHYYDSGEKTKAIDVLDQTIATAKQDILITVAKERKARILIDLKKADEALLLLSDTVDAAFQGIFEELKGDAYALKDDIESARKAYDKALILNSSGNKNLLQMKRDNLGESAKSSAA